MVKFSSLITTPIASITVKKDGHPSKTVFVHSGFINQKSSCISTALAGGFREAQQQHIEIEEDPNLFGYFIRFLYFGPDCYQDSLQECEYVILARLYCMGDRLLAKCFRHWAFSRFAIRLKMHELSDDTLCDLLEIVSEEMPSREPADALEDIIVSRAARRLSYLRTVVRFQALLDGSHHLAKRLCLRAGDASNCLMDICYLDVKCGYSSESVFEEISDDEVSEKENQMLKWVMDA